MIIPCLQVCVKGQPTSCVQKYNSFFCYVLLCRHPFSFFDCFTPFLSPFLLLRLFFLSLSYIPPFFPPFLSVYQLITYTKSLSESVVITEMFLTICLYGAARLRVPCIIQLLIELILILIQLLIKKIQRNLSFLFLFRARFFLQDVYRAV